MTGFTDHLAALRHTDDEDRLRHAASRVMQDAVRAMSAPEDASALFTACDRLSTEAFERSETTGTLLICAKGHPSVDVLLEMSEPVPLRQARAARKMLQLSVGDVAPACDGASIWGLCRWSRPYDGAREDLFEVRFVQRSRWQFLHAGRALFEVENRRPALPREPLARERFDALVRGVLGDGGGADVPRLWAAVSSIIAGGRGSTAVITPDAAVEAARLAPQGTRIVPRVLEPAVVQAATGIGGAMLLDGAGVCHAIGVILDGVATAHGKASRGSRFNSAVNYVAGRTRTIAVVVSDDGSVDVFPD